MLTVLYVIKKLVQKADERDIVFVNLAPGNRKLFQKADDRELFLLTELQIVKN